MQRRSVGTAIRDRDTDQDVLRSRFRVLDQHVEVAIGLEHAGVDQLELSHVLTPPAVFLDQPLIRVGCLRVLVERLQVRMGRRRVEVVVQLLHVLAVIALGPRQPEQPLLEDRVVFVPQREREG